MRLLRSKRLRQSLNNQGTTLVETIVCLVLVTIMLGMLAAIITPAFRVLRLAEDAQNAQVILDNLGEELQALVRTAEGSVKIYHCSDDIAGQVGANSGSALEFVNTDGYVMLISAEGVEGQGVQMVLGDPTNQETGSGGFKGEMMKQPKKGRLFTRYYWCHKEHSEDINYDYVYQLNGQYVARALGEAFGEGYYMDNYLKITFSYPEETLDETDPKPLTYLNIKLSLYSDPDMSDEHLLTDMDMAVDFRYIVNKNDNITAKSEANK